MYALLLRGGFAPEATKLHSFSEFDFSSYAFGLVAVALSFAGIYISIILESCNDQLYRLLTVHFIPIPFQDVSDLEKACHPSATVQGIARTSGICCVHAIVGLKKWSALSKLNKAELLGPSGLGAGRSWFGPLFSFFQSGRDRLIVASIGISTSLVYVALPAAYWMSYETLSVAMLSAMYVMCVLEILVCASLYLLKWFFISGVEKEMPKWHPEISNTLVMAAMNRATGTAP